MVLSPTRITDESQSILDLVITNNPDNILNLHVVNPLDMQFSSDHLLVLFDFIWKPKRPPKQSRFVYSYKKADFDALRDTLDATPFLCALDNENVDGDWQCWHGLFIACVEQHVPKIKIRDINSPPWIDSEVIHLLHKMVRLEKRLYHVTAAETPEPPKIQPGKNTVSSAVKARLSSTANIRNIWIQ